MSDYQERPIADPTIVRQLTSHLARAYENFINSFDGRVDYVEGMMAAHNFHVFVIEYLVRATGQAIWRQAARDTFVHRMNNPGAYDTKRGEDSDGPAAL